MRRLTPILFLIPLLALAACERDDWPGQLRLPEGEVYHDMIQLGEKLDDPYTVQNMRSALAAAYPTKADRVDIQTTDLYVRFLPLDDSQLKTLEKTGIYLLDHPMDYQIVREGDYYQDPEVDQESITWQYSLVPRDYSFPAGIRYEILDECYLSEHDPVTRASDPGIDWTVVEQEAYRLTGNEDLWMPATKGSEALAPSGRITIEDPECNGGKPFGLAGVMVACNAFVKIATCYTDRDGYYQMEKTFSGTPRYRLVFQNENGFNIGFNFVIIPASVCTLGKGGPEGIDYNITEESDANLFRRSVINNAAYEYYSRCNEADLDIATPPSDLRIWVFPDVDSSSASMLHHGAFPNFSMILSLVQQYLGQYTDAAWFIFRLFAPDITIGTKKRTTYADIYDATVHELAHASHYMQAGNAFWDPYIRYIMEAFITEGKQAYGTGGRTGSGYCEVGEMWAYFMEASLYKDRYNVPMPTFGTSFWFRPEIFSYLYERGMTRGEIYRALKPDVCSTDDLKEELIDMYPERETLIDQTFTLYGK
jgi:hypothetical protein